MCYFQFYHHSNILVIKHCRVTQRHPFHLVDFSPWSLVTVLGAFGDVMVLNEFARGGFSNRCICIVYLVSGHDS